MTGQEQVLALQVEIAGNQHADYEPDGRAGNLRLVQVVYPDERFPGDLCAVCHSLTDEDRPLGALLLGNVSHPAGCRVEGRLLGMLEWHAEDGEPQQYLIAVAAADPHFSNVENIADLSELRRRQIASAFQQDGPGHSVSVSWGSMARAQEILKEARRAFRLAQTERRQPQKRLPAWKPLTRLARTPQETESSIHTAAEYRFQNLPARFQQYVTAYLADDERILLALHRPPVRSVLQSGLLRGKRLEEATFIISTQQITEIAELMPPDRAGIRYGFVARSGLPERLESVDVRALGHAVTGLHMRWHGSGGVEQVLWEFPDNQRKALEQAIALLRNWLPRADDRRLRRATPPEAPEEPEPLYDPAANDPEDTKRLAARLEERLSAALAPTEAVLARCLLPDWIKGRDAPSLLVITPQRFLIVADPAHEERLHLDIPLHAISSFEFSSTLIRSYLKIFVPERDAVKQYVIRFAKTLAAMDDCFLALRQATGVIAPVEQSVQTPQKGDQHENDH